MTVNVVTVTGRQRPDVIADRELAEQYRDAVYAHGGEAVLSVEEVLDDDAARALIADASIIAAGTPS
jgi:uncharacterized membrane protein